MENTPDRDESSNPESSGNNPWATRLVIGGWILITIKSVAVWWACVHYAVPFHPLWIIAPTAAFATLCTGVYLYARR